MAEIHGLTMMAACPLTNGHVALLAHAANNCDRLTVLLGDDHYGLPWSVRAGWLRRLSIDMDIVRDDVPYEATNKVDGVVVDESYWDRWLAAHQLSVDRVFTSDLYGREVARRLKADWWPYDPDRSLDPHSATMIRNDPERHWDSISPIARIDLGLTFCVVGAESTGKSTLVQSVPFNGTRISEWGRTLFESVPDLGSEEFFGIASTQHFKISLAKIQTPFVLTDTDALQTLNFSEEEPWLLPKPDRDGLWSFIKDRWSDVYFLPPVDRPFVQDGGRVQVDQATRVRFNERLIEKLETHGREYWVAADEAVVQEVVAMRQQQWRDRFRRYR